MIKLKELLREINLAGGLPYDTQISHNPTKTWYTVNYTFKTESSVPYVIEIKRAPGEKYKGEPKESIYKVSFKVDYKKPEEKPKEPEISELSLFELLGKPGDEGTNKPKNQKSGQDNPESYNYVVNLPKGEFKRVMSTVLNTIKQRIIKDTVEELLDLQAEWKDKGYSKDALIQRFPTDKTVRFTPAARAMNAAGDLDPTDQRRRNIYKAIASSIGVTAQDDGDDVVAEMGKWPPFIEQKERDFYKNITGEETPSAPKKEPSDDKNKK